MATYQEAFDRSINDPEGFWLEASKAISWFTDPSTALDSSRKPFYSWFPGGTLNTSYNALDRHVNAGRGQQDAIIYHSAVTDTVQHITYDSLLDQVERAAGALAALGVTAGDRVVIYLPMIPEAIVSMLACARIGAVHSVVFGGFAAAELATRLDDARPKVVISATCGIERTRVIEYKPMLDAAIERAEYKPEHCIIIDRPQAKADMGERDLHWHEVTDPQKVRKVGPTTLKATDPLYILYTSGTTGKPKGIVRDNGGHAVAMAWTMRNIYDIQAGDVWFTASDVGWVVGHSYICYAPLLVGATTVLFEGKPVGTPDAGEFWRMVESYGVKSLFTAPTAIRAIRKEDPEGKFIAAADMSSFKILFLAGERTDPDTLTWANEQLGVPVIDHWWQTETAWAIAGNPMGLEAFPVKPGSATKPMCGYDVKVLGTDGEEVPEGEEGAICVKLPLPPGCLPTLWQDDERYISSYISQYPGHYLTGDGGYIDEDGYVFVMGRTDDVLNVAGHRLSAGGMEAAIAGHPAVAECAVIGVHDTLKGQVPRALVVLKAGYEDANPDEISQEIGQRVRSEVGAIATLASVDIVAALPKTRSGKILRKTMRELAEGKDAAVPGTIEDASVLDDLMPALTHE